MIITYIEGHFFKQWYSRLLLIVLMPLAFALAAPSSSALLTYSHLDTVSAASMVAALLHCSPIMPSGM